MIGLQAAGEASLVADGVAECGDHFHLVSHDDLALIAHDLADGRDHFWRKPRCQCLQLRRCCIIGQKPVPKHPHGHARDRIEGSPVIGVDDEARYLIDFIRNKQIR